MCLCSFVDESIQILVVLVLFRPDRLRVLIPTKCRNIVSLVLSKGANEKGLWVSSPASATILFKGICYPANLLIVIVKQDSIDALGVNKRVLIGCLD